MPVALVMELVLAIGVGLGLSRATMGYWDYLLWQGWSMTSSASFFAGVALVFGPATWLEAARRKERAEWGTGRQIWSTVALYYLITNGFEAARLFLQTWLSGPGPGWVRQCYDHLVQTSCNDFFAPVAIGIVSFGITRLISRSRSEPPADPRESILRVAAALLVLTFLGLRVAIFISVR